MQRKHFKPRSARKSVKAGFPAEESRALIEPWLRLANLLPPLDDLREVRGAWSRIRKLTGLRTLAGGVPHRDLRRVFGSMPSQWLEGRAFESSLPNATDFMEKAKAAGLAKLVSLRPGPRSGRYLTSRTKCTSSWPALRAHGNASLSHGSASLTKSVLSGLGP